MARKFVGKISKIPKLPLMKCQIRVSCPLCILKRSMKLFRCLEWIVKMPVGPISFLARDVGEKHNGDRQGDSQWRQARRQQGEHWAETEDEGKVGREDKDENNELLVNIHLVYVLQNNTTSFSFEFLRSFFFFFNQLLSANFMSLFRIPLSSKFWRWHNWLQTDLTSSVTYITFV